MLPLIDEALQWSSEHCSVQPFPNAATWVQSLFTDLTSTCVLFWNSTLTSLICPRNIHLTSQWLPKVQVCGCFLISIRFRHLQAPFTFTFTLTLIQTTNSFLIWTLRFSISLWFPFYFFSWLHLLWHSNLNFDNHDVTSDDTSLLPQHAAFCTRVTCLPKCLPYPTLSSHRSVFARCGRTLTSIPM